MSRIAAWMLLSLTALTTHAEPAADATPAAGNPVAAGLIITEPPTRLPTVLADRTFDVYLDDREVGAHSFSFSGVPGDFRVTSEASFAVKIAFVTVFSYEHMANEHWRSGCMVALESSTESSEDNQVSGTATSGGFALENRDGGQTYNLDCAWGFAYWNPALRERPALINPQDGKLFEVAYSELEIRTLDIDDTEVATRAWSLQGEKLDITLYYDADDRWLGLDSALPGGRVLRYRPAQSDPLHPTSG